MPRQKRRTKKKPEAAAAPSPEPAAVPKILRSKRNQRPGRPRKTAEPVPVVAEVKSVMHRILEGQREQLNQLSDDLQQVIFFGW
jgi:hypothetical protein